MKELNQKIQIEDDNILEIEDDNLMKKYDNKKYEQRNKFNYIEVKK